VLTRLSSAARGKHFHDFGGHKAQADHDGLRVRQQREGLRIVDAGTNEELDMIAESIDLRVGGLVDDDDALPPSAADDEEGLDGDSRVAICASVLYRRELSSCC
jgi:hypothetical protein